MRMISIQANAPNLNLTDCLKTALIVAMQIYIVDGRVREVPAARLADVAALRPALLLWEIIPERTIGLYPMNRVSDPEPMESVVGDTLKPADHTEHDAHRDEADAEEYGPCHPDGAGIIDERADPEQQIADGCGTEPEALAEALQMFRGYF